MLKIRFSRAWKKNAAFYRIVLTEQSKASVAWFKEVLGYYNPITKDFNITDVEKVQKYLANGAKMSERVEKLYNKSLNKS